jgi:hemolysin III
MVLELYLLCIPILIALAIKSENMAGIVGAAVYGFCFLQLFTFSTLYHGIQHTQAKHTLEILDHISIYFLIAGRYLHLFYLCINFLALRCYRFCGLTRE